MPTIVIRNVCDSGEERRVARIDDRVADTGHEHGHQRMASGSRREHTAYKVDG